MNNAVKHAQAQRILSISYSMPGEFNSAYATTGKVLIISWPAMDDLDTFGLIGMRERAEQIGGTLSIHSTAGSGTEVVADVPISS